MLLRFFLNDLKFYAQPMKMKNTLPVLALLVLISASTPAQDSKGKKDTSAIPPPPPDRNMFGQGIPRGVTINTDGLTDGYVLFQPTNSASFYLMNRKGEVVHEWKGNYGSVASSAYMTDDGSIFKNAVDPDFPVFAGGGEAGRIEKITWDNEIVWDFEYANEEHHAHHDLTVMPNGNILAIAWEAKTPEEAFAAGRKKELTPKAGIWPDKIVEIQPTDRTHGKIVWEWHFWDHLVQGLDAKKANFGKPSDHPELLDINIGEKLPDPISNDSMKILIKQERVWRNQTPENWGSDVYHINAIKYNADLDQIAISSPHLDEIFIIDHSTTTREAASHKGGRWGKGGDFLFRWGNPANYGRGDSSTKKLYGQHDIRWIEKGKPGAGHLTVYNNHIPNRNGMNYSAIHEIVPPTDGKGNYIIQKGKAFGPEKPVWTYMAHDTVSFWSGFISGAHRMENGNTFINEGAKGRLFEVTNEGKIVWEFLNHFRGDLRKTNGDPFIPVPMTYSQFRATFIPASHPGLANKKLQPLNPQPRPFVLPPPPGSK